MIPRLGAKSVSSRFYTVAGRLIEVETTEEWIGRMAGTFLSGFYLDECGRECASREADCRVRIVSGEPLPAVPPGMEVFETRHGFCHTDGESYHLEVSGSRILAGPPGARRIDVWLGDTPRALSPIARVNVMSYTLHLALRRCGLYDLHGAGAVEPRSRAGVLFAGGSNSGKSTLTVRLARAGWPYLSDDQLLLHEGEGGIEARGLRRIFSVSAPTLAGCQLPRLEEALGAPVNSDPNKRRLDPSIVFPRAFAPSCEPRVIYFPVITGEPETRVESIGQAEVVTRLLKFCPWASFDVTARDYLNFLSRLVGQAKGYVLNAGLDVMADPDFAPRFIAAHVNN